MSRSDTSSEHPLRPRTKGECDAYLAGYAQAALDIRDLDWEFARKTLALLSDVGYVVPPEPPVGASGLSTGAREDAIESVVAVLWRSGLGKLSREECRAEAERVIEALRLSWPCNRCLT